MSEESNIRLLKNTTVLYLRMIVVMALNLYTSRLVLQALGVNDYGLYNVVGGLASLFAIINSALSAGTSRFIIFELGKGSSERLQYTFSASFFIHLSVSIVVLLLAETIGLWYVNSVMITPVDRIEAANWVYQFSVIACVFSLTQVPYSASIIAHENMSVYAWVGIIEALIKLLLILLLMNIPGDKLIYYGVLLMVWNIFANLFYRYYCGRHYAECRVKWVKDRSYYQKMLSFSLWDVMGVFAINGYSQGINMLMNYFFGLTINAAKGVAYQVQGATNAFSGNFLTAVKPQIVKLYAEGNIDKMQRLVIESSKISYFLLLLIVLPIAMESRFLLNVWLEEVPEKTALFVILVLAYSAMRSFAAPIVQAVHATGNIKYLNLFSGGTSIVINLPFTYVVYLMGAPAEMTFYILLISTVICNYTELYCLKREIGFNIFYYTINVYLRCFLISAPALIVGIAVMNFMEPSFLRLIITASVTISFIFLFAYVYGFSRETKDNIIEMFKSKFLKNEKIK